MSSIPLQMEWHQRIKMKKVNRKVLLWQHISLTVEITFLFNILIYKKQPLYNLGEPSLINCDNGWSNNRTLLQVPMWAYLQMNTNFLHSNFTFRWMICRFLRISYWQSVALMSVVQGMKQSNSSTISPQSLLLLMQKSMTL